MRVVQSIELHSSVQIPMGYYPPHICYSHNVCAPPHGSTQPYQMLAPSSVVAVDAAGIQRRALGRPGKTHRGEYIPVVNYSMLRRIEGGLGGCR